MPGEGIYQGRFSENLRRKRKRKKRIIILLICLVLIGLACVGGLALRCRYLYNALDDYGEGVYPEAYNHISELSEYHANDEGIAITVEEGDSASSLSIKLKELGVIDNSENVRKVAVKFAYSDKVYPGVYWVKWGISYKSMWEALTGEQMTVRITFPEYFSVRQDAKRLKKEGLIKSADKFERSVDKYWKKHKDSDRYPFLKDIKGNKKLSALEGYLYPATYIMNYNMTDDEIIEMMLDAFSQWWDKKRQKKAEKLNLTTDEVIILASMVEREAADDSEMKDVAGVFVNRIKTGMYLQSCATIEYVFENDDDPNTNHKLRLDSDDIKIDSPYNTYKNFGLPVGAICSPGVNSIDAVLNYKKHNYYYFVMGKDGKTIFSSTAEEHARKVQENLG